MLVSCMKPALGETEGSLSVRSRRHDTFLYDK